MSKMVRKCSRQVAVILHCNQLDGVQSFHPGRAHLSVFISFLLGHNGVFMHMILKETQALIRREKNPSVDFRNN